ncbi:MAG: glycoside hydrolase family 5 protein [Methylococcaceae bacterium]
MQNNNNQKCRGVNLGGWLLLEKWITPSLFEGLNATDETSYCVELGEIEASKRLTAHWNTYITRDDFAWLAKVGINSVRLPIGHWLFGRDYPYHQSYGDSRYPFVVGGLAIVDKVFTWATEFNLRVVLDLHAAPGCQNGFDNGGIKDVCEWHTDETYIAHSLNVLERLAERYHQQPMLHAIEVLNEPRWDVPTEILKKYNTEAYYRIRRYCTADKVAVVFHDGFRSYKEYIGFMQAPEFENVVFDIHRYQCFTREEIDSDIYTHIQQAAVTWKHEADAIIHELALPTYCGEWSLGLDLKVVSLWAEGPFNHALEAMDDFQMALAYRAYAAAQLLTFEKYQGWFFWNYKTETTPAWCFRECVTRGWIPDLSSAEQFKNLRLELLRANGH